MASAYQIAKNKTTNFTMGVVRDCEASDKGLYLNILVDGTIYSVDSKLFNDNCENIDFEFKVSKNGLWLIDSALTFSHDRTM